MRRRTFLRVAAADSLAVSIPLNGSIKAKIKAIAFDAFTTFDPRPVSMRAEKLFPGRGVELNNLWRTRQFEYTWLRTMIGAYADFWRLSEEALIFAARFLKLDLTNENRTELMQSLLDLRAWPDSFLALQRLKASGIRMVLLSNFTEAMLRAAVRSSGLEGFFEPHLSADRVRAYKPDPRAYRMAVTALNLRREEITFAAFGLWDAAGAKAFGFPSFWVNRMDQPLEELGHSPDASGATLHDLAKFVIDRNARR